MRAGMLIGKAGSGKRQLAQMEHTRELRRPTGILRDLTEDELRRLLHEETIVVEFEPEQAQALAAQARALRGRPAQAARDVRRARNDRQLDERQRATVAELRQPAAGGARRAASPSSEPARARKRGGRAARGARAGEASPS